MSTQIHPTAIIEDGVELGKNVVIGPFVNIKSNVEIGDNTIIEANAYIGSYTKIGKNCRIFPSSVVGSIPQDLKFKGELSQLIIGDNTTIREFCMINRGTKGGGSITKIGSNNLIMAYVHIAHDCILGNNIIVSNAVQFAGHVVVEDNVVIGGMSGIHQFVRIGKFAMIGGMSGIGQDVAPFCLAAGPRAKLHGLNLVGLKRAGFSAEEIEQLKNAYKTIFKSNLTFEQAFEKLRNSPSKNVIHMIDFLKNSNRGFCRDR
ncbi:acyl-ACP--UDP-N-acetylglucosamine O-acyltransferase [Hippea maritima]|uniref:Acyl-[acyl-carrier-protein]--UDP-N-acetylglucosamine O-acyltransferase n=1 Tax=Hippea maritima (strain ATCC 700847 / DSM 10411 / MH2) TaxID=760142 RepID=F2LXD9_HIPMA|nr:acyl-ACP--UDP-N-acetylglucosamine O-acyltransferase [Hippea maritima]AEA34253.1 Acyl-(acyl-carrier-protein)--UDP-N-acetylglucosamine O-acyltransferase [Hippea maritima DSM 10411]